MSETWVGLDGSPLKFQYGERVKINRPPERPGRIDGWVGGYDLATGEPPAYEISFLGDPEQVIVERALERQPEHMQKGFMKW